MRLGWHALRFIEDPAKARVECAECGKPMWLPRSKLDMYQRCGVECASAWRRRIVEARTRPCETCGKLFAPRPVQITKGGGRFCSQGCNTPARAALQTDEAKAKAVIGGRAAREAGRFPDQSGPNNSMWRGGAAEVRRRRRESGKEAAGLRAYRKRNPEKVREFASRRRGRKLARLPYGTIPKIGEAQRWKCAICRTPIKRGYHVDHVMPLARGGEHVGANLQLLCATCNVRKNAKDPIDYMRELGRLL